MSVACCIIRVACCILYSRYKSESHAASCGAQRACVSNIVYVALEYFMHCFSHHFCEGNMVSACIRWISNNHLHPLLPLPQQVACLHTLNLSGMCECCILAEPMRAALTWPVQIVLHLVRGGDGGSSQHPPADIISANPSAPNCVPRPHTEVLCGPLGCHLLW
jgi:hypothetical protein